MAKIALSDPNGPYGMSIDTEVMLVRLTEVFLGVRFETTDGEILSVCMRDSGYELRYETPSRVTNLELKNGTVVQTS